MTDRDNITLPREVVQEAVKALEFAERNHDGEQSLYTTEIAALRKALAAEQQEPVADEEAPRLWAWMREGWSADCGPWYEVIRNDQMTWRDRKGWTPLYTALAAEPTKPSDDVEALRRDAERLTDEQIDSATSKERDQLLDHIYEYGTAAEGILERIRKLARAAIDAAMGEKR
jgi:hypothetical protein